MLEIKKLEDVVTWADNWIKELEDDLTEEEFEECEEVEEVEAVKEVVKTAIKRHAVYTQALKNDFANKAAEVEELEKENERLNKYTENLNRANNNLVTRVALLESEIESRKEEVKKLNKCIMEKNESIDTGNEAIINLRKQIGAHEEENKRLSEKIMRLKEEIEERKSAFNDPSKENDTMIEKLKKERDKYMARVNDLRMELDCVKASKEKHEEAAHEKLVEGLRENIGYWRNKYLATQEERDVLKKELEEEVKKEKEKEDDHGRAGFEEYIKYIISEEEGKFKEELNKRFSEEVSKISIKRTEEALAKEKESEVKGNGRTSSGRYPWGAKVNDIPCGEDAIE